MSFLSWFSRRKPADVAPPTSGLSRDEATRPLGRAEAQSGQPANRKNERMAQRERLYAVVRDSMNRAGVLSSSYKFKVLSLDKRGHEFMVMVDLAGREGATAASLAEIEAMIAQAAKGRDEIIVKAVYWRQNEHVAVGLHATKPAVTPLRAATARKQPELALASAQAAPAKSAFDPIDADEVAAFKRALAAGMERPARRDPATTNPAMPTGYEDTLRPGERGRPPALSTSQYGDLN
jgi:hypothetical protein